jgi:hypothetical protein
MTKNLLNVAAMQTSTTAAAAVESVGAIGNFSHLFQRSQTAVAANDESASVTPGLPDWAQQLIAEGDALVALYDQYKVEFFDRSDAALWNMLERIYQYTFSIEDGSANAPLRKQAFVKHLKTNGYPKASGNDSTASLVVKYVFRNQAKQTISNYAATLVKAAALKIPADKLAECLQQHGGYAKFLETYFDENGNAVAEAPVNTEAVERKNAAQTRIKNVRRLFNVMGQTSSKAVAAQEIVQDVVPIDERKPEAQEKDPDNSKYKRSNFVFFVAVEGARGDYNLVQGFSVNRQVEDMLLTQFSGLIAADNDTLNAAVVEAELNLGIFEDEEGSPIEG